METEHNTHHIGITFLDDGVRVDIIQLNFRATNSKGAKILHSSRPTDKFMGILSLSSIFEERRTRKDVKGTEVRIHPNQTV